MTKFLERQRLEDVPDVAAPLHQIDDDDVDHSLDSIGLRKHETGPSMKGKVQQIEWDTTLQEMSREKAEAEAKWGTVWART